MSVFKFKRFHIHQEHAAQKVGTDSMVLGSLCHWDNPQRLLDIGTGTGVLALMCAQRFDFREIIGLEISKQAIADAKINTKNNPFPSSISIINEAIQDYDPNEKFDAIISNPPFFENSSKSPDEEKSLARHTEALPFPELIGSISRLLSSEGKAWVIIPFENKETLLQLIGKNNLFPSGLITIYGKPNSPSRMIISISRQFAEVGYSTLCIRNENGSYTKEYKALTREFHDRKL